MPFSPPYIPARDSLFANWVDNFSALLTASPTTYGQSSGTAAAVAAAVSVWDAAYLLVTSPATKTPQAVQQKDVARASTLAVVRPVAQNISLNQGVLAADKIAIGVNPRTNKPTPITPPSTTPILLVQGGASLQIYLRFRDSAASPSVKAKPYGVQFVKVYYQTSATPITDPTKLLTSIELTKSPKLVQFNPVDGGLQCYFAALYVLKNGGRSGFGPIVSFTVPLGA